VRRSKTFLSFRVDRACIVPLLDTNYLLEVGEIQEDGSGSYKTANLSQFQLQLKHDSINKITGKSSATSATSSVADEKVEERTAENDAKGAPSEFPESGGSTGEKGQKKTKGLRKWKSTNKASDPTMTRRMKKKEKKKNVMSLVLCLRTVFDKSVQSTAVRHLTTTRGTQSMASTILKPLSRHL